ncbi:hypothetical protein WH8501_20555 [Crocosphaera watsonii WH 8501]|uniref:ribonuclease toxin HepT-like protein n=1 Tax=Crocosphaera watsonii TaxID=263511 RepID=UPI002E0DF875
MIPLFCLQELKQLYLIIKPRLVVFNATFLSAESGLDESLPKGENWHEQLLRQMADIGGYNRPPLWQGSLLLELDEYRKFRHLVRHNYQVKLKAYQLLILAQKVIISSEKVKEAITTFNLWLDSKANSVGA